MPSSDLLRAPQPSFLLILAHVISSSVECCTAASDSTAGLPRQALRLRVPLVRSLAPSFAHALDKSLNARPGWQSAILAVVHLRFSLPHRHCSSPEHSPSVPMAVQIVLGPHVGTLLTPPWPPSPAARQVGSRPEPLHCRKSRHVL